MHDYSKNQDWQEKTNLYKRLKPFIENAKKNASQLSELVHKNNITGTTVHRLVELLLKDTP
jgi:hypothetical protein